MTEPPNAEPGTSAAPAAAPGTRADLEAYVATNAGRYTDEALYGTLVAAGYAADDVRAALASAASLPRPPRAGRRAFRTILAAYVAVFAILSVGMLLNGRSAGHLMPDAEGGIGILAASLGAAFVASLIWLASRRLFAILVLLIVVVSALSSIASGGGISLTALAVVLVIVGAIWLIRRPRNLEGGREAELAVLLSVPILLLLGVGGICVASGLPIPGM